MLERWVDESHFIDGAATHGLIEFFFSSLFFRLRLLGSATRGAVPMMVVSLLSFPEGIETRPSLVIHDLDGFP